VPGSWLHLASRFLGVLQAARLDPSEEAWVRGSLRNGEESLFFAQNTIDQRHGHDGGRWVADAGRPLELVRAALLHDVGKRHSRLGTIGRTLATLAIKLRLPLTARARMYRDHGRIGATDLARLSAEALVVDYTRHHHGVRPQSVTDEVWRFLLQADHVSAPGVPPASGRH
jgi:hypothetical protein